MNRNTEPTILTAHGVEITVKRVSPKDTRRYTTTPQPNSTPCTPAFSSLPRSKKRLSHHEKFKSGWAQGTDRKVTAADFGLAVAAGKPDGVSWEAYGYLCAREQDRGVAQAISTGVVKPVRKNAYTTWGPQKRRDDRRRIL